MRKKTSRGMTLSMQEQRDVYLMAKAFQNGQPLEPATYVTLEKICADIERRFRAHGLDGTLS